jgi:hypothetical protein
MVHVVTKNEKASTNLGGHFGASLARDFSSMTLTIK